MEGGRPSHAPPTSTVFLPCSFSQQRLAAALFLRTLLRRRASFRHASPRRAAWRGLGWLHRPQRPHRLPPRHTASAQCGQSGGPPRAEKEIRPATRDGERVVFRSHFLRGFGLPVSAFFRSWLDFYQLQPHHLTPNTVVLLSAFVTLCEGFLGVLPTLELWGEFFQSKLGTVVAGVPAPCGAFIAMRRTGETNPFLPIPLIQSVKLWQKS